MNYFRCTVGGSGGKWKLTVTCTNVFAGLTITCTDGTTTLTKICPSASPYTVVFNIPNAGTWTISGVYGGKTNTTTVVIPDTATLNYIPTGSTATPVNDIQTWLHCANIWDKSYTTINQVLADTSTLLALISSNNAADYMARSTNWASSVCANQTAMGYIGNNNYCANKLLANSTWLNAICDSTYFENVLNVKVPTMTSDTAPSGVVSYTDAYNNAGYYAFDGNDSTFWEGAVSYNTDRYIKYEFANAISPKLIKLVTVYTSVNGWGNRLYKYKLQASTDNSNWETIKDESANTLLSISIPFMSTKKYKYFRLINMSCEGGYGQYQYSLVCTFQIYGRA